ncbi:HutD family protein [Paracoccus sp. CPCC 101403]|uniref:HutD family protein n=1 Tax=Paracoccus broussonetiae TaxID=3075834 RepID=A0ABU3EJV3_9RHOB|nr:HutD family protein [Paracoccus sp. CPCC 101403]MDT1064356.1 HutD family protein [Paracoccus sp. CPCC 101403]
MSIAILSATGHRRMPWKNGRGVTTEIAVHPQGAGLADFGWRVSMAAVDEDGDFSIFPGIDRSLAVLSGDGIALSIHDEPPQLLGPGGAPLSFPADVPVSARLPGRPITDLNVMTRRGHFWHSLARVDQAEDLPGADWRLVLATEATRLQLGAEALALGPLDAVLCQGQDALSRLSATAPVWLIRIGQI